MRFSLGKCGLLALALSLACAVPTIVAKKKPLPTDFSEQKRAAHALNRLTFGPRPGDIERVTAMGVDAWIDLQMHPEKRSDSAVDARLASFRTLRMSSHQMVEEFPDNQMIRQVMDGKKPMPSDPARRAVFQVQIARMQEKKEKKQQIAEAAAAPNATQMTAPGKPEADLPPASETAKTAEEIAAAAAAEEAAEKTSDGKVMNVPPQNPSMISSSATLDFKAADDSEARRREDRLYADLEVQKLLDLPANERYKKVMSMSADEQIAFADSLRGGKGQEFLVGLDPKQKETLLAMNNPEGVFTEELMQAKLLRA